MKKQNRNAFTLVELVIVAVILAILATVGFISYEDYLVDTRDSKRLSQLAGLRDSMRLQITRGKLPLPDDSVEIRNNTAPFLYQGYAGKEVLETISYSEKTMDPFDDVYYTYLVSRNRKDFQVMGFLEKYNKDVISLKTERAFANVDYSQRYPNVFGKKLGILLQQESNTPLQEIPEYTSSGYIDLSDSTSNLFDAYVTDIYKISGKETDLTGIIPYTTCKKIQETGGSYGDGIYNINPSGLKPFEVYCNMTVDGGGWALVAKTISGASGQKFGWLVKQGNIRDQESLYSMGKDSVTLNFSEIMFTTYTSGFNIEKAIKVRVDNSYISNPNNYPFKRSAVACQEVYPLNVSWMSACDTDGEDGKVGGRNFSQTWGWLAYDDGTPMERVYSFRQGSLSYFSNNAGTAITQSSNTHGGIRANGYVEGDCGGTCSSFGEFHGKQALIFVR